MTLPATAQAAFAAALVDEWVRAGLTDAVVAPGSRSSPLTLALASSALRVHVHIDERSAGFFALGLALASGRPAPVVTTSGTAPAHLLPAAMEAEASLVPMILCTADRPTEDHLIGSPQTSEQAALFAGCARWRFALDADLPPSTWRSIGSRAVAEALHRGPVHLNIGFREPLVATPAPPVPPGRPDGRPWHSVSSGPASALVRTLVAGRTGIFVATDDITDPDVVFEAAAQLGWPVLAGPRSRCRRPGAVSAFDGILRDPPAALQPEVVVRLGGVPASKVTNGWLAALDADHVVADPYGQWIDPARTAAEVVAAPPEAVCRSLVALGTAPAPDGWAARWLTAEQAAQDAIDAALSSLSEPLVARTITRSLPADATLLAASSMPIRDVEWFGDPGMQCRVVANRGVNGIDGLVSTALGLAAGGGQTVALLGDLAFLHDSGGLTGAGARAADCTFVVIDNGGGGIFNFLPQAGLPADVFERFWGTPHGVDLALLAAAHGLPCETVESAGALSAAVRRVEGVRVLLVRTDRAENVVIHDRLNAAVQAAVDAALRA